MMKHLKKLAASSAVTIAALALAIGLLGYSTIGGARAALTYYSDNYISEMQLLEIGVTLYENDKAVATGTDHQTTTAASNENNAGNGRGLLQYLKTGEDDKTPGAADFHPGVEYPEVLTVHNATASETSDQHITQYIRVTITRYWTDAAGHKTAQLDPSYIQLLLGDTLLSSSKEAPRFSANGWLEDNKSRTDERMVLYYTQPVEPGGETNPFADTFQVKRDASTDMTVTEKDTGDGTIVTRTYLYNGAQFHLDIRVDAVQNHHAADAMQSAWGRTVLFNEAGEITDIQ